MEKKKKINFFYRRLFLVFFALILFFLATTQIVVKEEKGDVTGYSIYSGGGGIVSALPGETDPIFVGFFSNNSLFGTEYFPYTSLSNFTNNLGFISWVNVSNGTMLSWAQALNGTLAQSSNLGGYLPNTGGLATGNYTFDTSTLFIDSVSHRIGFGTTTPNQFMQVVGTLNASQIYINGTAISAGLNGANGLNGTNGNNGTNGTNGLDGANGINGTNGLNSSDSFSGNYSTFLTHITWTNVVNGTVMVQSTFNSNYTTNDPVYRSFVANYSTFLTYITWSQALNGTLATWNNVVNGSVATWVQITNGTMASWLNVVNGTLTNQSYYNSNYTANDPVYRSFFGNYSNFTNIYGYIVNQTTGTSWTTIGNGSIAFWSQVMNGTMLSYLQSLNGTLMNQSWFNTNYSTLMLSATYNSNYSGLMLGATFNTNYSNFYPSILTWITNSSSYNASWNAFSTNYTVTGPYLNWSTLNNGSFTGSGISWATAMNGSLWTSSNQTTNYTTNDPMYRSFTANYSTFLTHITWANAVNGTLRLSTNNTFFGIFNFTNASYSPIFSTSSDGNISFDNNNFFWDNIQNHVGIKTISPQNELNVVGDANVTTFLYQNNIQTWWINQSTRTFASAIANLGTNVTGTDSGTLLANKWYNFDCKIVFSANKTASGIRLAMNSTAVPTFISYTIFIPTNTLTGVSNSTSTIGVAQASSTTAVANTNYTARLEGTALNTANFNLFPTYGSYLVSSSVNVSIGSNCRYEKVS